MKLQVALFLSLSLLLSPFRNCFNEQISNLPTPDGFSTAVAAEDSYSQHIYSLPLEVDTTRAVRHDQSPAFECCRDYHIIDLEFLFDADLEQCADMGYRLFAEYCFAVGQHERIDFRLQNGQRLSWPEWRNGKRLRYDRSTDRHLTYTVTADSSRQSFDQYLRFLFTWAGSWAVLKYADLVERDSLQPGDMIVQNRTGGMGHLSIICDICENEAGDRLYLIGSGWTPAQEIIIHRPGLSEGQGHWFTLAGYQHHLADFDFGLLNFRRFAGREAVE